MAVGRCAVAIALVTVTVFRSADAARDERVSSSTKRDPVSGCQVQSLSAERNLTLKDRLGTGADGAVYKAQDQNGKFAAVKLFNRGTAENKEARNFQKLNVSASPHIIKLEPGFEKIRKCCERHCLVTEFIAGSELRQFLSDESGLMLGSDLLDGKKLDEARGTISFQLLRSILFQSLTAFRDTERAGLCNIDQHLGNIMFDKEAEHIVFIDFGAAQERGQRHCSPNSNFAEDSTDDSFLQSFASFEYLLKSDTDRNAYRALCERLRKRPGYQNAQDALDNETLNTADPGAFFNLHADNIITQQRKALNETGSPYIGRVSG